jgi:lysine 6-dehydrogenase
MRYVVLSSGMMGSAAAFDLAAADESNEVLLADLHLEAATRAAGAIGPNVHPRQVDANNQEEMVRLFRNADAVLSAVPYSLNLQVTRAAIEAGTHMCDLGGSNEILDQQLTLSNEALGRNVTIVPNCGLAPGLINILAVEGFRRFDRVDSIRLRVGGLPQNPRPPLFYQITFSVEGLINEYLEPVDVIKAGRLLKAEPLSDLEEIEFPPPFGRLEAFNTSGGISSLPRLLHGKVQDLDYKTIRYRGHCEKFKTLIELGFASAEPIMVGANVRTTRELFAELLRKKLDYRDKDVVLARATIEGSTGKLRRSLVYELIDYYDVSTQMTAMMRTTAFPTSVIAQMLAQGRVTRRGVFPPEEIVPGEALIRELSRCDIRITERLTETPRGRNAPIDRTD